MPEVKINARARVSYSRRVEITDEEYQRYLDCEEMSGDEYSSFFEGLLDRVIDHETDIDFDPDDLTITKVQ